MDADFLLRVELTGPDLYCLVILIQQEFFCQAFYSDFSKYFLSGSMHCNLTRSAAPNPVFKDGVRKRTSGSTLSKPWPSGRGVEGLT